jgi:hypothetical protein
MKIKLPSVSAEDLAVVSDIAPAANLIAACFAARTQAHILHLQTESYAQHKALNSFYDGIISAADAYAESYQGRYGRLTSYPTVSYAGMDAVGLVSELRSTIDNIRVNCGTQPELQNAIDTIVDLCNSTLYLLTLK